MSSIDEVIARSRAAGTFAERRQFTVARDRAIEKLREFALVDPHYYILELIQSAVGNGATYLDIQADRDEVILSYVGGSFRQEELGQLFDFLFASKDSVEHGPLRQLALGVNALMLFEPDEIVIETGDGTAKGTTRAVVRGGEDIVEVGRPEQGLEGTFVRAQGMRRRKKVTRRSSLEWLDGQPPEYQAVEERCITAPVPILFNHKPLFGYSSQRLPTSLWGIDRELTFDEGDLYGTIGVARRHSGAVFKLVTHGVWVQSVRRSFEVGGDPVENIGGVITFDGLRKTADHGAIVEDDRFAEMWLRVQPYVNQLFSHQDAGEGFEVRTIFGEHLEGRELLQVLRKFDRVVMVPVKALQDEELKEKARKVGEAMESPVLFVPPSRWENLRALGGSLVEVVTPDLEDEKDLAFYMGPDASVPMRPWLTAPVELGRRSWLDIARDLPWPRWFRIAGSVEGASTEDLRAVQKLAWLMGESEMNGPELWHWKARHLDGLAHSVRAQIYSPVDRPVQNLGYNVEVRVAKRRVWHGWNEDVAPGQVVIVDITDMALKRLWAAPRGDSGGPILAEPVARIMIENNAARLDAAAQRALEAALRAQVEPASNAAKLILATIGRRVVKRIRRVEDERRVCFSVVDPGLDRDVLDRPLLKTISGEGVSLRGIEELLVSGQGHIYAVIDDPEGEKVDLKGLDREKILHLDPIQERLVIALVGPTAYVRVDGRDVLAEFQGLQCRDIALGLREYPEFPLLVEGEMVVDALSQSEKKAVVDALVGQLVEVVKGVARDGDTQEDRRQAWRHLQYFAFRQAPFDFAADAAREVNQLPLFALADGRSCGFRQLQDLVKSKGQVEMLDGRAHGAGEWRFADAEAKKAAPWVEIEGVLLAMNPFVLTLLGEKVRGAAEYILSPGEVFEEKANSAMLIEELVIDNREMVGRLGVARKAVPGQAVVVFGDEAGEMVLRRDLGAIYSVVGKVRLRPGIEAADTGEEITSAARDVLYHLMARLPQLSQAHDEEAFHRALQVLWTYAGGQVQWTMGVGGRVDFQVAEDGLAQQILSFPVFRGRNGLPVSTKTLFRAFQRYATAALMRGSDEVFDPEEVVEAVPAALEAWVRENLDLARIHRPSRVLTTPRSSGLNRSPAERTVERFAAELKHWIEGLRPDDDAIVAAEDGIEGGQRAELEVLVTDKKSFKASYFSGAYEEEFCRFLVEPQGFRLVINGEHRLTKWAVQGGGGRAMAWALLAAYAVMNNVREPVTNAHEVTFQHRVLQALEAGELSGELA